MSNGFVCHQYVGELMKGMILHMSRMEMTINTSSVSMEFKNIQSVTSTTADLLTRYCCASI